MRTQISSYFFCLVFASLAELVRLRACAGSVSTEEEEVIQSAVSLKTNIKLNAE